MLESSISSFGISDSVLLSGSFETKETMNVYFWFKHSQALSSGLIGATAQNSKTATFLDRCYKTRENSQWVRFGPWGPVMDESASRTFFFLLQMQPGVTLAACGGCFQADLFFLCSLHAHGQCGTCQRVYRKLSTTLATPDGKWKEGESGVEKAGIKTVETEANQRATTGHILKTMNSCFEREREDDESRSRRWTSGNEIH